METDPNVLIETERLQMREFTLSDTDLSLIHI